LSKPLRHAGLRRRPISRADIQHLRDLLSLLPPVHTDAGVAAAIEHHKAKYAFGIVPLHHSADLRAGGAVLRWYGDGRATMCRSSPAATFRRGWPREASAPADSESQEHPLLALSGLRFEELRRLRVVDCGRGALNVRACAANRGRRREVPLHGALARIVIRLTKGRPANAFLFRDGAEIEGAPSLLLRRFDALRRTLGAAGPSCGIHSLRRWFVRTALEAEQPPQVVAAVIGQDYAPGDGAPFEQRPRWGELCVCVARVRLPGAAL
jgi:integrase